MPRARRRRDEDVAVWRYVTYPVYLELLRKRSLHFTRVDRLDPDDPFEGRFLLPEEWAQLARASRDTGADPARAHFAVSCWCAADGERTSLWERYASPFGVALKTTLGRLRKALDPLAQRVHVGPVSYAEDRRLRRQGGLDVLRWMLRKRRAFEDEQEVRAVVWSAGRRGPEGRGRGASDDGWPQTGLDLPVDVDLLVQEVWVGPPWEEWFFEQVRDVSRRLGLSPRKVRRSTLMDVPPLDAPPEGLPRIRAPAVSPRRRRVERARTRRRREG